MSDKPIKYYSEEQMSEIQSESYQCGLNNQITPL